MGTLATSHRLTAAVTASAGQTDFAANFPVLRDGSGAPVGVFMRRVRAGLETILSLGDFTIPPESIGDNGFTCRLLVPAMDGDQYQIFGKFPPKRDRAHAPGGATRTDTLEGDSMQFAVMLQEQDRELLRSLKVPFGEDGPALPPVQTRKAGLYRFASDGSFERLADPQTVVAINAEGDAITLPIIKVMQEIGADFIDDGLWTAQGPINEDGVWG